MNLVVEVEFDIFMSFHPSARGSLELLDNIIWLGEHRMPITVYMKDKGGIIAIAEYGQEYGTDKPIRVLYHGFGHYEALHLPEDTPMPSRL